MTRSDQYPASIKGSTTQPDITYTRVPDRTESVNKTDTTTEPAKNSDANTDVPVYTLGPGASPAVPTGLVMVRFCEDDRVSAKREDLERLGYEIVRELPYAPHAALVGPTSGRIADALAGLDRLETLAGVENVEPQMISERTKR